MQSTAHSVAFIRETCVVSKLNARRLIAGVRQLVKCGETGKAMVTRRLIQVITATLACCIIGLSQSGAEAKLRARVLRYHSYFIAGKAGKMWEMSSRKLQRENDEDKAGFIRQMPIPPAGHGKTRLLSMNINGKEAVAKVEFQILPVGTDKWVSETYDETWVFERGDWFFDSYHLTTGSNVSQGGP